MTVHDTAWYYAASERSVWDKTREVQNWLSEKIWFLGQRIVLLVRMESHCNAVSQITIDIVRRYGEEDRGGKKGDYVRFHPQRRSS